MNLERAQFILSAIGQVEDDIFKKRQKDELAFRQRAKDKKRRNNGGGGDMPQRMPEWMKSGPYAPQPLGRNFVKPVATSNKFEALEDPWKSATTNAADAELTEEEKRGVKRKHPNEMSASGKTAAVDSAVKIDGVELTHNKLVEILDKDIVMVEDEEDEDANDPVR